VENSQTVSGTHISGPTTHPDSPNWILRRKIVTNLESLWEKKPTGRAWEEKFARLMGSEPWMHTGLNEKSCQELRKKAQCYSPIFQKQRIALEMTKLYPQSPTPFDTKAEFLKIVTGVQVGP
jgi:hypothetical protein